MHKLLGGAVGVLGIGLGYHFFFSSSLDETVREHSETMTRHEAALDRHDTEIQETRKDTADNSERIEILESELKQTRVDLAATQQAVEAHEAKVKEMASSNRENTALLDRLKDELAALRMKYAELESNQARLERAVAGERQLIRTRLDQIEERLGISAPDR